ncbi:LysR family transcriptional regulator [Streptomyces sp. NPDC050703]|uniref:LysR family transcriptional regulator n=1 Tax=Streptomyces sp. NPDC050703 TaxID=3157218 RepID=UPI003424ACEA
MTLDDLRVFVAVCRAGSLSAVARDLACTQSAVSQHVKRLEKECGVGLLERHARGVVPTSAGRLLAAAASDGIGGIDLAVRRLREQASGDGGTVRVTTGATSVRHFMTEAVVGFRERHPRAGLEFQTMSSSSGCFDALAADDLDLAWITLGEHVRGIEQRPVVALPWVLAVRPGDPLADRPCVELGELATAQLITPPAHSTSRAQLDRRLAEAGVELPEVTSVADWDTAVLLAELGLGHAVVPALPGEAAGDVRMIPVPGLPPLTVGWAVRRWDALTPLARAFADTVAEHCATPGRVPSSGPAPGRGRTSGRRTAHRRYGPPP